MPRLFTKLLVNHWVLSSVGGPKVHFGRLLAGVPHVCRFLDAFEEHAPNNVTHLWLVFRHEVLWLIVALLVRAAIVITCAFCACILWFLDLKWVGIFHILELVEASLSEYAQYFCDANLIAFGRKGRSDQHMRYDGFFRHCFTHFRRAILYFPFSKFGLNYQKCHHNFAGIEAHTAELR